MSSVVAVCTACRAGMFRCLNGRCLQGHVRCDQRDNCIDNSDELNCSMSCDFSHCNSAL